MTTARIYQPWSFQWWYVLWPLQYGTHCNGPGTSHCLQACPNVSTKAVVCVHMHWQHFLSGDCVQIGSIATAAGVGGGAFFVPLFNILLNFSKRP